MGLATLTLRLPDGSSQQLLPTAVSASSPASCLHTLASPVGAAASLDSPALARSFVDCTLPSTPLSHRRDLRDPNDPVSAEPGAPEVPLVTTPPFLYDTSGTNMDTVSGGALAPARVAQPPQPAPTRPGPGFRLPPFHALGITTLHPDRLAGEAAGKGHPSQRDSPQEPLDESGLAQAANAVTYASALRRGESAPPCPRQTGRAVQIPVQHYVNTITPPVESGGMEWNSVTAVSTAALDSPPTEPSHEADTANGGSGDARAPLTPQADLTDEPAEERSWVDTAISVLTQNYRSSPLPTSSLRVLSHALPSPSASGHIFPEVVSSILQSTPASETIWINVFHAIPGRFNLADLPTSPPATPGPPIGGDDYFTSKTFDTAVPITDYQDDLSSLPRSPRPVVPPSSIDVSIVERYIPPTSINEFGDMFNPNGPSILVDRLVELSPNNGSLVFIYPTRRGAQTFMREYLGPILDPVLRSMTVVHGLSSDLGRLLGRMGTVEHLSNHDTLLRQINTFCARLSQRSSGVERFHARPARFALAHASTAMVTPTREAWARDWWAKQEKPRIREAITHFAQEAQKKSSNEHVERAITTTELLQQLLDSVAKKPYPSGGEPKEGIEVSVFIIKKSE